MVETEMIHRLRLGLLSFAAARAGLLRWIMLALCSGACGDGDILGDGGVGMQGSTSITARCGDGTLGGAEQCDDGNTNPGDGCSSVCVPESSSGASAGASDAGSGASSSDAATSGPDAVNAGADAAAPTSGADAAMDAGATANDSGSEADSGEAAAGDQDASAPAEPEPLCPAEPPGPCEACNCTMCRTQLDACTNLSGVASEGPAQGTAKAALCEALVRCGRSTGCRSIGCVCTEATMATCLGGETPPDGPCNEEVLGAAETTDMLTFITRASTPDMGYAVAVVSAVSMCAASACATACAAP
jgi:cysteine-rich repeat protein